MDQAGEQASHAESGAHKFSTQLELSQHFLALLGRSRLTLQMFDPDFSVWHLGSMEVDAALRHFLGGHGKLELVAHDNHQLETNCPRFMRTLKEYGHAIECRTTPRNLRNLTDSFCVGDGVHIVRRFHSDYLRGEAVFDQPAAASISLERYAALWPETQPGLHAGRLGL